VSPSEVLTLALAAQWPRGRSERACWRYAGRHLRPLFPALGGRSRLNRRIRAAEPLLRALHRALAGTPADAAAVSRVPDTTLIPALRRVRACRHGLFAGQASFGRCASKAEWASGCKVALAVRRAGLSTAFGLAPAACDERPIGAALVAADRSDTYPADKGYAGAAPARRRWDPAVVTVIATPPRPYRRAAGKRQVVEQAIGQLKDSFAPALHRAKTLSGLLARLAAKVLAFTCAEYLDARPGRPLRHVADLVI
jgi:hypothetical protein